MSGPARGNLLYKAADILDKTFDSVAADMTREEGKTLPEAKGEVRRAINIFRYFAGEGSRMPGDRKSTRLNSSHVEISYAVFCLTPRPPRSSLFPYTTLFRSHERSGARQPALQGRGHSGQDLRFRGGGHDARGRQDAARGQGRSPPRDQHLPLLRGRGLAHAGRSEEHTSELQSRRDLVCRLLLDPASTEIFPLSLHDALPIS